MKIKRFTSVFLSCMLSVSALIGIIFQKTAINADAVSACLIDTTSEYQTICGFVGINLPEWIGDLIESQRQTAFGNGDDKLGLSVLRTFCEQGFVTVVTGCSNGEICTGKGCNYICESMVSAR